MKTIEEIRAALGHIHAYALQKTGRPYMSIPADPNRDADLILSAAIDELAVLRLEAAQIHEVLAEGESVSTEWHLAVVKSAVSATRERCAKVAEAMPDGMWQHGLKIATAIRGAK